MRSAFLTTIVTATLLAVGGCPTTQTEDRTGNQGGGNIVSAGLKVANSQLSELTPDELQILVDKVGNSNPQFAVELTDEQAADAVDFLAANNLDSIEDVEALIADAEANPGTIEVPESLEALLDPSAAQS